MGSLADMAERKKSLADMASQRPESTIFSLADEWLDEPFESPPSVEQQAKDAFALSAQRGISLDQSESVLSRLAQRTALEKQAGEIEKRKAERGVKMEPGAAFKEAFIQSMSDKPAMMLRGVQVYTPGRAYGMDDMAEKAATYLRARQDPEVQKRVQERAAGKLWPVAEGAKWYNVERQYLPEVINSWATHVGDQIPILLSVVGGKLLGRAAGKVAGPVAGAASALITGGPDPTDLATAPLVAKGASWLVEQIGGAAPLVAMEAGAFLDDAEALGIDRDLAEHYARLYGLGSGAIEYVQDLWVLDAYKRVPLGSRAKVMRAVLSEILGSAGEFGAEVSQEGLERHLLGKAVEQMKERNPDFKAEVPGIFEDWKRTGSIAAGVYFVTRLPGHGLSMAKGRLARQSMVQARMGEWSEVSFDDEDQAQDFAEQVFDRAQAEGMDVQLERQNEKVKYRMVPKAAESTAEATKPPAEIGPGGKGFTPTFQPEVPIIESVSKGTQTPASVDVFTQDEVDTLKGLGYRVGEIARMDVAEGRRRIADGEPPIRREAAPAVAETPAAPAAAQAPAEAAEEAVTRISAMEALKTLGKPNAIEIDVAAAMDQGRDPVEAYRDYFASSGRLYGGDRRSRAAAERIVGRINEAKAKLAQGRSAPAEAAEEVTQRQAWEMTREEYRTTGVDEMVAQKKQEWDALSKEQQYSEPYNNPYESEAYIRRTRENDNLIHHKAQTQRAVADNKPVPRAVLEEYKGEPWADAALAKLGEAAEEVRQKQPELLTPEEELRIVALRDARPEQRNSEDVAWARQKFDTIREYLSQNVVPDAERQRLLGLFGYKLEPAGYKPKTGAEQRAFARMAESARLTNEAFDKTRRREPLTVEEFDRLNESSVEGYVRESGRYVFKGREGAALAKLGESGTPATGQEGAGGIFDRAAGGKTGWTASYTTGDFGTERWVTVKDAEGNVIGQRDPFWNRGIPKSEKERQARIRRVAKEIVEDYDAKIMQRAGTEIGPEPQSQGGQPQQAGPAQPETPSPSQKATAVSDKGKVAWEMTRGEYEKAVAYKPDDEMTTEDAAWDKLHHELVSKYRTHLEKKYPGTRGKMLSRGVAIRPLRELHRELVEYAIESGDLTPARAVELHKGDYPDIESWPEYKEAVGRDLPTSTDVTGNDFSTEPITKAEKDQLRELGWSVSDIAKADPAKLREFLSLHEQNRRQGGFLRIHFGRNETVEQKVERAIADLKRQLGESQRPMERTEAEDPDAPVRERQFITRLKEMEILGPETTAEYHVRDTDALAIKAANLVREDIERAERMARTGTDDNAVAVACELLKHYHQQALAATDEAVRNTLYDKISEVAHDSAANLTELGRAVQAASILAMQTPEGMARFAARTIEKYNASHKNRPIPHLTAEQVAYITQRIAEIQAMPDGMEKAVEFQKLMDYVRGLVPATVLDKILTLWKAGLLTGIKTSGLNTASNLMHGISEVAKDIPAVAVDSVLSLITGKRTLAFTVAGTEQGLAKGVKAGWMYVKTGFSERDIAAKLDWKRVNFGKSKVAKALQAYEEFVFRILGSEDQPFYYGAKARSIAGQAIAMAKNENLTGDALRARAQEIAENPTDEMLRYAVIDAETAVFQNRTKLGDAAAALQRIPGAGFIIPFGRTPSAIAMQILNYSPVGAVKAIAENMTNFDQRLFSQEMGRAALGTGVLWLGAMLFRAGLMTLDRPKTDREEEFWNVEGRSANSIKIGGKWRSVQVLGPVGSVLVVGGHFAQALDETGSPTRAIVAAASGGGKSFTEQTYLRGMNEAMRAIGDLDRSWNGFVSSLAGSVVPTLVADIARANDSVERRTTGPVERIVSRVPVARETLEPRINVFGQDLPRYGGNVLEVMADPTRPAKINQDVVVDELRRLWDTGLAVSPTLLGNRDGYDVLTKSQNTELWRRAGEITYVNLFGTMQSPMYAGEDDDGKAKLIERAVEEAKITARTEMAYSLLAGLTPDVRMVKMMEMRKSKLITNDVARELERLL